MVMDKERIAVFDLDGTLINGQSQQHLIKLLLDYRLISYLSYFKLLAVFILYHLRIVKDMNKIVRYAYTLLRGIKAKEIENVIDQNRSALLKKIYRESNALVNYEINSRSEMYLLSASVDPIVSFYSTHLSINRYYCTQLEIKNGIVTGNLIGLRLYGAEKARKLEQIIGDRDRHNLHIVCYTDHVSDIELAKMADETVLVNPDKTMRRIARVNKWRILRFSS